MFDFEVIGQGATTKIYRDSNTAIKLYVNAPFDEAENEAERQQYAYDAGLPVPYVYGVRKLGDNITALDMEYINGQPLMQPQMDKNDRNEAIHTLVKLQCEAHRIQANGMPKQTDRITWKIKNTTYLGNQTKDKLLSTLMQLTDNAECLCHGDFHPLNILYDGNKHWIIDWVDATAGNPLADACRTYLIFKQHMSRSSGIYLREFCNESGSPQNAVLAWQPVVAAARLNENMDDKSRKWLLEIANRIDDEAGGSI
jgi:aminoglycoside phosphotransferase (APT) family kinase protein